ncbi:MAG: ABC transporter permease subunit [Streptosporangiales bacterium]|nr:ABC transporter permease subunit [Streptosporangiales bacterium]
MATSTLTRSAEAAAPAGGLARPDWRAKLFNRLCLGVLLAFAAIWIIPLAWAVDTAFKPEGETTIAPVTWLIDRPNLEAFGKVLGGTEILNWYVNSAITSTLIAATTVVFASMAGFALSRVPLRARSIWFWFILAGIMVPSQALIVPLFREFNAAHLLNTYWSVVLPQVPLAIAVFVFKQFFDGLPDELVDAAHVDGASWLRVYLRIFMPLSIPAISAVTIFTFVWSWNNFLWPLIVLTSTPTMTLTVGLATVQSDIGIAYAQIMASAVLGLLPLLTVFLLFQRRIVEGIAGTGLKG